MGIIISPTDGVRRGGMCKNKLAYLPQVCFASVWFRSSFDCRQQHLPCPPYMLVCSASKLPVKQQPATRTLDNTVQANVTMDEASRMNSRGRGGESRLRCVSSLDVCGKLCSTNTDLTAAKPILVLILILILNINGALLRDQ